MNPDLRPLRDIHDSLGSPWWPLAPGWWLVGLLLVALAALIWRYRHARRVLPALPLLRIGDWRWDAHRELRRLRQRRRQEASSKARLSQLAELLKRIAMARHGRAACARLHGPAWLEWLSAHDPDGFDWRQHGQCLIHAPYAPEKLDAAADAAAARAQERQLERLIAATERWIRVRPEPSGNRRARPLGPDDGARTGPRPGARAGARAGASIGLVPGGTVDAKTAKRAPATASQR